MNAKREREYELEIGAGIHPISVLGLTFAR